ncbi:8-hydroxygeraniol oxidoreductase-like [Lathyrus oleraceus]|uniref:8-hydroxygeraniol oxidoreductase-like n=1 Tax=Pisum sativum TaxID=3888 RepID=UPI0021D277D6|nr:8-hydroxygeraniol oxidoreductase-like [Pisum sativum]
MYFDYILSLSHTCVYICKTIAIGLGVENIVPLDLIVIIFGRTLKGSVFGGLKTISDLCIIADKCQKEELPLHELLTHEVPLSDINKAFELLKQPDCVKVVVKM